MGDCDWRDRLTIRVSFKKIQNGVAGMKVSSQGLFKEESAATVGGGPKRIALRGTAFTG
jgi:hypothetical protein